MNNGVPVTADLALPQCLVSVSEDGGPWVPMPRWVRAFIEFGFRFSVDPGRQRLVFVSTPCDSPAAGLIALGSMIRRMENEDADDVGSHYSRLVRESLRKPEELVLRHRIRRGRFRVEIRDGVEPWLCEVGKADPQKFRLLPANATEWRRENDPQVESFRGGAALPNAELYRDLTGRQSQPLDQNLRRSDSAIALAGRATGMEATRKLLDAVYFANDTDSASLSELLSVHAWDRSTVSRIRYLSSRGVSESGAGAVFDRPGSPPLLVVADGPAAFRAAQGNEDCSRIPVDMVTVVPRTGERDELESFASDLERLRQWYEVAEDSSATRQLSIPGVVIGTLVGRS